MTQPFYNVEENGIGILFNGTCGFEHGHTTIQEDNNNIKCASLRIRPLDHQQEPGDLSDGENQIITDGYFVDLTFTSKESVDVVIDVLKHFKEKFFNE